MNDSKPEAAAGAWLALQQHHAAMAGTRLRELFAGDPGRSRRYRLEACGLFLDYSRHLLTDDTLAALCRLASESGMDHAIEQLFAGAEVNLTEHRPALHPALRSFADGSFPSAARDVMPAVRSSREQMRVFCERVRGGRWRGVTQRPVDTLVVLGIGGSRLGPELACDALEAFSDSSIEVRFVSHLDPSALSRTLDRCAAERTLFVVTSKSFSTEETLTNARSARTWLQQELGDDEELVARHFIAVTAEAARANEFGIPEQNVFEFWEWVGGRYSLWSAVGLPIAVSVGMDAFEQLLSGAEEMDAHFRSAPVDSNMPLIMALIEVWYRNFYAAATRAVLPYDHALSLLPDYLAQLEMESNGKSVDRNGRPIAHATAPVVWGAAAIDGQHAFFQMIQQGPSMIPADFIVALESQRPLPGHQEALLSNALAQATVLMRGRSLDESTRALQTQGLSAEDAVAQAPHRVLRGNQPSSLLVYEQLDPRTLGALLALYEHKVYAESVIWGINAFDQWGVELGKTVAKELRAPIKKARVENRNAGGTLTQRVGRLLDGCAALE